MKVRSFAAIEAGKPLEPFEFDMADLGPDEVDISISHCGLCYSDIGFLDNHYGMSVYPMVAGNEIVGTITEVGKNVKNLKSGQRVGVGIQSNSCGECEHCKSGHENVCPSPEMTIVGRFGGFAERIHLNQNFVIPIPDVLESADAAPLFCGGITVYSPLSQFTRPSMKVGVLGIGGLGHLALQFAHAFDCEVTALSGNVEKEKEARGYGADHFIVTGNEEQMEQALGSFDILLNSTSGNLQYDGLLALLKPKGTIINVGIGTENIAFNPWSMLLGEKVMRASAIGTPSQMEKMLEFVALKNIKSQNEIMPMDQINDAINKVKDGKARYRMVLVN